jgi:predicted nucleic acid-binding protein
VIAIVDTSVWIDLFADRQTLQTAALRDITRRRGRLLVGDLVLMEVLQGTRSASDFAHKLALMSLFDQVAIGGRALAIQAAQHYQALRTRGITVRKSIDTLIATRCITDDIPLLYSDRDFDPFVQHLGLRSASDALGVN